MPVVLACDLGGTTFRAALIDQAGRTIAEHTAPGPAEAPTPTPSTHAEIDAEAWWHRLEQSAEALARHHPLEPVAAIAICGVTRTQVPIGRDGALLRPAITWRDARAAALLDDLRAKLPPNHPETASVNAYHPLARLAWLARHEPATLAALHAVVDPKDFLNFRLTGTLATDPVSGARLLAAGPTLLAALGLPTNLLPPLLPPQQTLGTVRANLPGALGRLAGVPVLTGANDTFASVLGLGALRPGFAYSLSGTTEVFGVIGPTTATAEGLVSVDWGADTQQLGGPGLNGADALAWLIELLGTPQSNLGPHLDTILAAPRQPPPILFLPYLNGERVPFWDPRLRGAFIGLDRRHHPGDLAAAVLEGIAFVNRIVLTRAEAAFGLKVQEIRFGGGGSASTAWAQVKADICERPVAVAQAREAGLLGAALLAWTALGHFPSLAAAQAALATPTRRFEPNPARTDHYRALAAQFTAAHDALRPISHALGHLAAPADLMRHLVETYGTALAGAALVLFFALSAQNFATAGNLLIVLKETSLLAIPAIGFTLALVTAELDLSFADLTSLAAVVTGALVHTGTPTPLAIAAGLATGLAGGLLNGAAVTLLNVPSLIATLGTAAIARGLSFLITQGVAFVGRWPTQFTNLARGTIAGIPNLVLWLTATGAAALFLLKCTRTGAHMTATGEAAEAARLAGIATRKMKVLGLALAGSAAGLTAVLLAASLSSAAPNMAADDFLYAIAATLLGMTMFEPGRANIPGTLVAAFVLKTLGNGLVLLGIEYYWQDIILGGLIIGSVAATRLTKTETI